MELANTGINLAHFPAGTTRKIDKKSLFGLHRPKRAEIMSDPILSSEFMV
jgi:hypothetical protein